MKKEKKSFASSSISTSDPSVLFSSFTEGARFPLQFTKEYGRHGSSLTSLFPFEKEQSNIGHNVGSVFDIENIYLLTNTYKSKV